MNYPTYWNQESNTYWLGSGGPIIDASLEVCGSVVEFFFYDGNRRYSSKREFSSPNRAKNFAIRFGRLMRQLDKEDRVPLPWKFEKF